MGLVVVLAFGAAMYFMHKKRQQVDSSVECPKIHWVCPFIFKDPKAREQQRQDLQNPLLDGRTKKELQEEIDRLEVVKRSLDPEKDVQIMTTVDSQITELKGKIATAQ